MFYILVAINESINQSIWVCAVYDVSHHFPQPHSTTFNPTLSHNMYCHLTRNTQQHHYHTIPHQKVMLQHFHNPGKMSRWALRRPWKRQSTGGGGGGGGRNYYYHNGIGQGAAPGCLLGGGAKLPTCLATAARAIHFCASPEKVASGCVCGGGGGTHFSDFKNLSKSFHNGVGVLGHDRPLSWQPKKNKQTNTNENHRGGGGQMPPAPRGAATG